MLRGVATVLEKHHQVLLLDEAITAAVSLSHRYIPARQLPDKAVSLLDTSCARVAVSQHATPPEVEDVQRHIEILDVEIGIIQREVDVGIETGDRLAEARTKRAVAADKLASLESRWQGEKALVAQVLELRGKLRASGDGQVDTAVVLDDAARGAMMKELRQLQRQLAEMQGERPLILPAVDAQAVASVVADWTGIPVGRMVKNEVEAILKIADTLNQRVIGQRHGLDIIAKRIQTSRARLDNPNKPIGVFMLVGPSGVGKTETALTLAETLYGGEQNMITINMSEFQEAHTVSTLKGAPPGYVGYGEGGVLTEAVRRKPYSVVLLDEVEKAHSDVHEIFFQVFDKGVMEDGEGRLINFKNTVIILTSNVGSELVMNMTRDPELLPEPEHVAKALREPLLKVFPAALLGRLQVIPYYPLSDEMLGNIIRLQLERIRKRVAENHKAQFDYSEEVVKLIASRCTEVESGGRMIDAILTNTILPRISEEYLKRTIESQTLNRVAIDVREGDFSYEIA
jgi:type VI secretion system protein VasG